MQKAELVELLTFLEIVDQGGIARAAAKLNVTPSAVGQTLRKFEDRVGVRLLNRTTRSLRPTDEGLQLARRARIGIRELSDAINMVRSYGGAGISKLRITVSTVGSSVLIAPHIAAFRAQHPSISVDVSVSDRLIDIVKEGFDAGIRRGDLTERGMIQQRLTADTEMIAVAAPSYLEGALRPVEPKDLHQHACITVRRIADGAIPLWRFTRAGSRRSLKVASALAVDNVGLALESAVSGNGVAYLARDYVTPFLASGQLIPLLNGWGYRRSGFVLFYPSQKLSPPGLDFLARHLKTRIES